jgi:hypothetical protein
VDTAGIAYVAWEDRRNGDWDIYFAKSTDSGATWSDPNIMVNSGPGNANSPSIAVDPQGTIYVAWQDDRNTDFDIYLAKSRDGGDTWTDPNIRVNVSGAHQRNPVMAVDSTGTVNVAWEDNRWSDWDIYFARSTDSGETWSNANRVNTAPSSTTQIHPTMDVDSSGTIYIAWEDEINGNEDIYLGISSDGGVTWSDPSIKVNTDATTTDQTKPSLSAGGEGIMTLVWQDNRNLNPDIYCAISVDGGATWTDPNIKINTDIGVTWQQNPAVAVSHTGTVYIIWHDDRNGNSDIYFSYSVDAGGNWTNPNLRVNDDSGGQTQRIATVAVGTNGPVFMAWEDNRADPDDIYSATNAPVNPFPTADYLRVEGHLGATLEIWHIISHEPEFSFEYNDPNSDSLTRYDISVWDAGGTTMLWQCNMSDSVTSGSEVTVTYNTAPCPTDGPELMDGESYRLRVAVENTSGVWSPASEVTFHLNEILAPVEPISPPDDSIIPASATQTVSWTSPGTDAEGDLPVTYSWEIATDSSFENIIESGSGQLNESEAFDTSSLGYVYWRVNLTDGWETGLYGNHQEGFWNFTAYSGPVPNNPPVITNKELVPVSAYLDIEATFTFTASDADLDTLSWTKLSGPGWLDIGSANGTIYGTPAEGDLGANIFTIQVSDGKGSSDSHTFTMYVQNLSVPNNAPVITNKGSAPSSAVINTTLLFTFTATDADGDVLLWTKTSGPAWLSIIPFNGTIYGVPVSGDVGDNVFSIQVSDSKGGVDSHNFTVDVREEEEGEEEEKEGAQTPCPWWILLVILLIAVLVIASILKNRRDQQGLKSTAPIPAEQEEEEQPEDRLPPPPHEEEPPPPPEEEMPPPPEDYIPPPPPEDDLPPPP